MTERLRFVIAGFFVGLAELLPGISGSTVAIAFKVYEKFILFLSNLKISNFSFNFKKLNQVFFLDLIIPFFIAMAISVIFASKFILFLYSEYTNGFLIFLSILMCSISFLIAFRLKNEFKLNMNLIIYFLAGFCAKGSNLFSFFFSYSKRWSFFNQFLMLSLNRTVPFT